MVGAILSLAYKSVDQLHTGTAQEWDFESPERARDSHELCEHGGTLTRARDRVD